MNSLTSRLPNASTKMFLMHAVYGFGATVSPLVSTAFVQHEQDRVYTYFAVSLGLAAITAGLLVVFFRGRTEDQVVGLRAPDTFPNDPKNPREPEDKRPQTGEGARPQNGDVEEPSGNVPISAEGLDIVGEKAVEVHSNSGSGGKMKRIMITPAVHYMALYIMIYVSSLIFWREHFWSECNADEVRSELKSLLVDGP